MHSPLNSGEHVSQSCSTNGNFIVFMYIVFKFFESSREDKKFGLNNNGNFLL